VQAFVFGNPAAIRRTDVRTTCDCLTDAAKIEKWLKRNRGDVIGRARTPIASQGNGAGVSGWRP